MSNGPHWRIRRNGNAIGGWLVEFGQWVALPSGPLHRPRRFAVSRQQHFHRKEQAEAALIDRIREFTDSKPAPRLS